MYAAVNNIVILQTVVDAFHLILLTSRVDRWHRLKRPIDRCSWDNSAIKSMHHDLVTRSRVQSISPLLTGTACGCRDEILQIILLIIPGTLQSCTDHLHLIFIANQSNPASCKALIFFLFIPAYKFIKLSNGSSGLLLFSSLPMNGCESNHVQIPAKSSRYSKLKRVEHSRGVHSGENRRTTFDKK